MKKKNPNWFPANEPYREEAKGCLLILSRATSSWNRHLTKNPRDRQRQCLSFEFAVSQANLQTVQGINRHYVQLSTVNCQL